MGCKGSKATSPAAAVGSAFPEQPEVKPKGTVEVYGVTGSMNCMGPLLLAKATGCGKLVACMPGSGTSTPEFLAMNPFHAVPTMKDGDYCLAESSAILRYMAETYAHTAYPHDLKRRAFIDWAMDRFATTMYKDAVATIYPVFGYASAAADPQAAGKTCSEHLVSFADFFFKEKFVGGNHLSIADYKLAPWFFCYEHPVLKEKSFVELPARLKQFNKDFKEACPAYKMLLEGGGFALKELLDQVHGSNVEMHTESHAVAVDLKDRFAHNHTTGKVKIYGVPMSQNVMGPLLLTLHHKLGELEHCIGEGTKTPEFLAMNPFHAVPLCKDGDFCTAESNTILRYLASSYAKELYPADAKKRGRIDWAMDRFSLDLYPDFVQTVYVCMGFADAPQDQTACGKKAAHNLKEFADFFLKDKFIGGEHPCLADYKVAPFFFSYAHPFVGQNAYVEVPERILQFNKDFAQVCPSVSMLSEAGGHSVKEWLDGKANPKVEPTPEKAKANHVVEEGMYADAPVVEQKNEVVMNDPPAKQCGCF